MPELTVHPLDVMTTAHWDWESPNPQWRHPKYPYYFSSKFDPFPAYRHDMDAVRETVERVQQACPPKWPVELYVADREETSRTNGWSSGRLRTDDGKDDALGVIMLAGKRIPPHPGMARYLVGHEYGHHISYMLTMARGGKHLHDDEWMKGYAALRGLPEGAYHHGNGGTWHNSVHEVFACDFRTMVCKVELDYWPHPGVPHSRQVPELVGWWAQALTDLKEYTP